MWPREVRFAHPCRARARHPIHKAMGGHASHGHTSDLAFMERGYGEETVVWDSVVIGDYESRNFHKVKRPWKVPFFRTSPEKGGRFRTKLRFMLLRGYFWCPFLYHCGCHFGCPESRLPRRSKICACRMLLRSCVLTRCQWFRTLDFRCDFRPS